MTQQTRLRILLADDYPGLTTAWRRLLQPLHDVVGEVVDDSAQAGFRAGASACVIKHAAGTDLLRAVGAVPEGGTCCRTFALPHPL